MPEQATNTELPRQQPLKTTENHGKDQLHPAVLRTPFKKLAMALSGGGFRAGAYSLGAMSYLHHLKYPDTGNSDKSVLDNVEFISSASGGTFAGILYSMHVRQEVPFEKTYFRLIDFMNGQVLLENVLELINKEDEWQDHKSRNFINAFSKIYDSELFGHETFSVYWPGESETVERAMEVCFNTTEFYRGISFRFQASTNSGALGIAGNKYVSFDGRNPESMQVLKMIRLGDIMAASSCFPAGFEPILFPKDFTYSHGQTSLDTTRLQKALTTIDYDNTPENPLKDIGFLDGGVDDNQGVYSAMLADKRRRSRDCDNGFDLIFVTDVASYFMVPYEAPAVATKGGLRKETITSLLDKPVMTFIQPKYQLAGRVQIAAVIIFLLSMLLSVATPNPWLHDIGLVLSTAAAIGFLGLWALKKYILQKPLKTWLPKMISLPAIQLADLLKRSIPALKNFSQNAIVQLLNYCKDAPLGVLEQMLMARLNSVLSMVLDVNLKQTRRLIFDTFYGSFYGENIWQNRRVFNVIYELSTKNIKSRMDILTQKFQGTYGPLIPQTPGKPDPWADDCMKALTMDCEKLHTIAENARTFGTTLWFDETDAKNNRMMDVIACGQFTTCAKLLEYVYTVERILQKQEQDPLFLKQVELDKTQGIILKNIKQQLEHDWAMFKVDPFYVANQFNR